MHNTKIKTIVTFIFLFSAILFSQEHKFEKIAEGLKFPEGPAYDGKGKVYVSNCYGDWITVIENDEPGVFVKSPTAPYNFEKTNGLTVYKDGAIYACDYGKGAILKFTTDGKCYPVAEGFNGKKFNRPNDLAFNSKSDLWFTDPKSYDKNNLDGVIYKLNIETGEVKEVYTGLGFPNGIAFSKDEKYLFVCESAQQRILKFKVEDDELLEPEVFAEMPGGDPDGIAFDIEGNLYVAHFGGGKIAVFDPDGNLIESLAAPGKKPSNVEFTGEDLKTLIITEDETNAVYKTSVEIAGLPLFSSPIKNKSGD